MPCRARLSSPLLPLALVGGMLAAGTVAAQTVYRCGPNGNVYAQQPCEDGRPIDVSDARGPAQLEEARQLQRREQALADRLARDRQAFAAAHPARAPAGIRSGPPGTGSTPAESTRVAGKLRRSTARMSTQPQQAPDFVAVAPGSAKKARRTAR